MAAKEPQGTSVPLLEEQDIAVCLEEGLSSEHDFQTIIAARPKRVVEWLQEEGVEKLGDFQVQVRWLCCSGQLAALCYRQFSLSLVTSTG